MGGSLVDLVLKDVEVVGGGNGDDVLGRVPGGVQDLLVEVQAVHADLVLAALAANAHFARLENGPRLAVLARGLQRHVALGVAVEHAEEVVVRAGHDYAAPRRKQRRDNVRKRALQTDGLHKMTGMSEAVYILCRNVLNTMKPAT